MSHSVLRQELQLQPAAVGLDGEPGWLLYDPVRSRYFRIDALRLELLRLLQRCTPEDDLSPAQLHTRLTPHSATALSPADIHDFLQFLRQNALLRCWQSAHREQLQQQHQQLHPGWFSQALRSYLFIRLPLFNPQPLLIRLAPLLRPLLQPASLWLLLALTLLGVFLSLRQLDSFQHALSQLVSPLGALTFALALVATKLLHEMGHAVAAHHYGCRVPGIGIALMVFWPVLYTDTTDAWRLTNRRQRLHIGAAGIVTELWVGALCLLCWSLLPDGPLRSSCFILATSSWLMSLAINLNPLMRFDGYFVLSDLSRVDNLQPRAFALGRWWLRRRLFGLPLAPPERPRRWLILFAWACWGYRFVLLLGIALIIYELFFKALGLLLIALHLYRSLVKPVSKELHYLWSQRRAIPWRNRLSLLLLTALLLGWLLTPGQTTLVIPAQLGASQSQPLYATATGQLLARADEGPVQPGQPLYRFHTPQLSFQHQQASHEIDALRWQLSHQSLATDQLRAPQQLQQELAAVLQTQQALARQMAQVQLNAPFAGTLQDTPTTLRVGDWVRRGSPLGTLVGNQPARVLGWANDAQRPYLNTTQQGLFYSDGGSQTAGIAVQLSRIASHRSQQLESPLQADLFGGALATLPGTDNSLQPQQTLYLLHFSTQAATPARILRGVVHLDVETAAPLWQLWRRIVGIWRREAGF